MLENVTGGPGCTGEWAGGHWEDVLMEDDEEVAVMPRSKRKSKPKTRPHAKATKPPSPAAPLFDGLF